MFFRGGGYNLGAAISGARTVYSQFGTPSMTTDRMAWYQKDQGLNHSPRLFYS